jgi:hypothetical protein
MDPFFRWYLATWSAACLAAVAIVLRRPTAFAFTGAAYWRFLARPWKLLSFALATSGLTLIAPYTGDPTWDWFDALFMALLTYASAPWAVGALYRWLRGAVPHSVVFVAACAWMFSASWSYDLYLVWRDGDYPATWAANIFASSVLYASAGLLWNLEWRQGRGVIFGFMRADWPAGAADGGFLRLAGYALPFMLIATVAILSFVLPNPFG